jgi:L-fuconolactonase
VCARGDYDWVTPELGDIYRDFTLDDWQLEVENFNVDAGMLVQAQPTEAEINFTIRLASRRQDFGSFRDKTVRYDLRR